MVTQLLRRNPPADKIARVVRETPIDATGKIARTDTAHIGDGAQVALYLQTEIARVVAIGGGTKTE